MSNNIDCRGMKCPLPVITAKKALAGMTGSEVTVIVDNDIAKMNVLKLAKSMDCEASATQAGADWVVTISRTAEEATKLQSREAAKGSESVNVQTPTANVYLITDNVLGNGDEELGKVLMRSLLFTISERPAPRAMIFMNKGVFLTCEGSAHIETLQKVAANGTEILACGTCLDYYNLKDKLVVGEPGNMYSALELLESSKVVKF
ncbi:MAG: sulfurtransferase-like selenium metabolism protein YedF [Negativicutes bacterium]